MQPTTRYARFVSRIDLETLDEFIAAVLARDARAVAMRVVDEIRPRQRGSSVEVGRQRFVELAAYAAGVVLAVRLDETDPDAVQATLTATGLSVRRRSANLG
jgi:hypothetical protein